MRRLTGQAAGHAARLLHFIVGLVMLGTVATAVAVAALAWRLSQGPLSVPWLAHRLEAAANAQGGPTRLVIGSAAVAWEGFRRGIDMPLDIRLTDVAATDASGAPVADVPRAEVSLSPGELLVGRLRPRAVEIEHARLRLLRAVDGSISLDLGSLAETDDSLSPDAAEPAGPGLLPGLITELARPAGTDRGEMRRSLIGQLRRVQVHDTSIVVIDHQLHATWRVPQLDLELTRLSRGGSAGGGEAQLALGDQRATLRMTADLAPGSERTQVQASLGPVRPASLALAARGLAPLSVLEAPVSVTLRADLGPHLAIRAASLEASAGAGQAYLGKSVVQLAGGTLALHGDPQQVTLDKLSVGLRAHEGGTLSHVEAHGEARRAGGKGEAALTLDLDQAAFADLPVLWPEGVAHGARDWVTENVTAGMAREAHVEATLAGPADLSDVTLTSATGAIAGEGLTIHWLRPIAPIERAQAKLRIVDPDTLDITAQGGQQHADAPRGQPLTVRSARIKVTGIEHPHQIATIDADFSGGLAEAVGLLSQPRLRLLDKHPLPGRDPGGAANVKLHVLLPLENDVKIEDIAIHADAHLANAHLADLVAGRDLDQGALDLVATNDGLTLTGDATLAGIPAQIDAEMDFRAGPPAQVLEQVTVSGRASTRQMAAAGLDPGPQVSGTAALQAVYTSRRDGRGAVQADADLTGVQLSATPIGWEKPTGAPARLSARVVLERDRLQGIDALSLEGRDVSVHGRAEYAGDRLAVLRFDRMVLGRTQAQGMVRFPPPGAGRPLEASFTGPVIDLSAVTQHRNSARAAKPEKEPPPGPSWTLDARFERAMMAGGRTWTGLSARAENDGRRFARLSVAGQTAPAEPFRLDVAPSAVGRSLTANAADAGALLAGLDLIGTMKGGRLTLSGTYDDRRPDQALRGSAEITDFRVRDPNGLGRLMQAMTLYGLVQAASGPGLGFTRLTAPFTLTDEALDIRDARAFNPSLGLTAKGHIDLVRNTADMQGTIVPAYFFNSLLGSIPVIGRLFSPEKGGGLFAASYTLRGPLDDPKISVNPLSALTPGFLRGVFGLF